MARFYDHPTGKLHFAAMAGGHGGGATSEYDAPATSADIAAHPQAHGRYICEKAAAQKADEQSAAKAELREELDGLQKTVGTLTDGE